MERVQRQDEDAFAILVRRHSTSVHAFLYRLCQNQLDAEDLTQETFLRIWQRAELWAPNASKFTTWLHKIAWNLCIDSFRRSSSTRQNTSLTDIEVQDDAVDTVAESNQASLLSKAIKKLPERQRTALVLCQVQGWSQRDAAQVLDTSVNGVQALIGRARRTLRDIVKANQRKN